MQVLPVGGRFAVLPGLLMILSGAAMLSCSDSQSPATVETCPDNMVTVSVQSPASATPSFSWTPACAVALLEVSALTPSSGVVWSIDGRMQNIVPSGTVYGHLPVGAEEGTAPVPLEAGVTYEVRVARAVPTQNGVALGGGGAVTFTH